MVRSPFQTAVADLLIAANAEDLDPEAVNYGIRSVFDALLEADPAELDPHLTKIGETLPEVFESLAAVLSLVCGAIVEYGGSPEAAAGSVLGRLSSLGVYHRSSRAERSGH